MDRFNHDNFQKNRELMCIFPGITLPVTLTSFARGGQSFLLPLQLARDFCRASLADQTISSSAWDASYIVVTPSDALLSAWLGFAISGFNRVREVFTARLLRRGSNFYLTSER